MERGVAGTGPASGGVRGEALPSAVELAKQHVAEVFSGVFRVGKHRFLG